MVLKSKILQLIFLISYCCISFAAVRVNDVPAVSNGDILFYIDFASFQSREKGKNYIELYLMIFADQLEEKDNKFSLNIRTILSDQFKKEINRKNWVTEASFSSEAEKRTMAVYDQWNESLIPGEYSVLVIVEDAQSGRKGEAVFNFTVGIIESNNFFSSSIEFASFIEQSEVNDHFLKGNKKVIPNPSRRYGILNPILYLYYELYNIELNESDSLVIRYSAISVTDQTAKNFPLVRLAINKTSTGITHGLNVGNLTSGIYDLSVEVSDLQDNVLLNLSRRFEIIQKDFAERRPVFSADDAEIFENILSILGTESQLKNYQKLSANAKGSYMVQFWKNMDPSPGTPDNEYLRRIQQRYLFANKNYRWGMTEGWKTDRGRVVIKYGIPDEIDHQSSHPNMAPYEIWIYRHEKKYIFVFGDPQSNGRFILLHSDKEGELYNSRWKEYLKKM